MDVDSVFITGSNRGIGLELARQLVQLPKPPRFIFATYRDINTCQELQNLRSMAKKTQIFLIQMDVTNLHQIKSAKNIVEDIVQDDGLTLLINNAGIAKIQAFPCIIKDNLLEQFNVNTVAPILILQEFLPLLKKAAIRVNMGSARSVSRAAVLNVTSFAASILASGVNDKNKYPVVGYKVSKAGLNMAMRAISGDMEDTDILVVNMCPGWVKTDMSGESAELEVSESVSDILRTLPTLNDRHHGSYINRHGEPIPF